MHTRAVFVRSAVSFVQYSKYVYYKPCAAIVCVWVRLSCDLIFEFWTTGKVAHTVKYTTILGSLFLFLKLTMCTLVVVGC